MGGKCLNLECSSLVKREQRVQIAADYQMNERKTPTAEMKEILDKEAGYADEEAKAKLVAEQARIQQHYKRLVQQKKDYEHERGDRDLVDEVYQGHGKERQESKESLPASLVAARPGSRSGITGTSSDPRFGSYNDEIQRHLSRRQAQYHSQRREHPARSDRPVSNFYEYESVQSNISHGRQQSQSSIGSGGSGMHHSGLPMYSDNRTISPSRHEMPPPRNIPNYNHPQGKHGMQASNTLSVAPISSKYGYYATTTRAGMGDYEDHRNFHMGPTMTDYDDPYGRIMFRDSGQIPAGRRPSHPGTGGASVSGHTVPHPSHRMQHSLSHPRIQSHQVPNNHMYKIPSTLPPGSKV